MGRLYWRANLLRADYDGEGNFEEERIPAVPEDANLVSSLCSNGNHMPILDLDFPCVLKESSTPGHFHLYLNREVEWEAYERLLLALYECGLIEEGYYTTSVARGATFLRTHRKGERDHMEYPEVGPRDRNETLIPVDPIVYERTDNDRWFTAMQAPLRMPTVTFPSLTSSWLQQQYPEVTEEEPS